MNCFVEKPPAPDLPTTRKQYLKWLRAAYLYYVEPGEDTGMADHEWDWWSRKFFEDRLTLPAEDFPVVHRQEFIGGSLFWLKRGEYPPDVR